jgi:hypothetical protein
MHAASQPQTCDRLTPSNDVSGQLSISRRSGQDFDGLHRLARLVNRRLKNGKDYVERGAASYEERYRQQQLKLLQTRPDHLGLMVQMPGGSRLVCGGAVIEHAPPGLLQIHLAEFQVNIAIGWREKDILAIHAGLGDVVRHTRHHASRIARHSKRYCAHHPGLSEKVADASGSFAGNGKGATVRPSHLRPFSLNLPA